MSIDPLRVLARALLPYLRDELATTRPEYYDQHTSPLGAATHKRLVKAGKLEGKLVGKRYVVERAAVEAYLRRAAPESQPDPVQAMIERALIGSPKRTRKR
jgi:hypothetical protein